MQVINESLDDLKKLEAQLKATPKAELGVDDDLFLKASIAQSKAIAGLALAIKEGGSQDTFGLTPHAPDKAIQKALIKDICDFVKEEFWEVTKPELDDLRAFLHERLRG